MSKLFSNRLKSLSTLTIGGFTIGLTEYLMMGLLPDAAKSLLISIPKAGSLIYIYALGVVIGAPLMIALTNKISPKKLLALLMFLFFIFHVLFCLAPNYYFLLFTRFLSGLPHGAFFGIGAVVATELAEPGKEASSVAVMFTGLTLANCLGVPIATYIGHTYNWRLAFLIVALSALTAVFLIIQWLPNIKLKSQNDFKESFKIFKQLDIWLIIGMSAIGTAGTFAWISYIAPLMTEVIHFSDNVIGFIMMIAGFGMILGNIIGGKLADKLSPLLITGLMLLAMILCLQTIALVETKFFAILMTFITGMVAFAIVPTMQMLMIQAAKSSQLLASSIVQASANMSNTLGAFLGGLPLAAGFSYTSPEYVGMGLAFVGLIFCLIIKLHKTYIVSFEEPVIS